MKLLSILKNNFDVLFCVVASDRFYCNFFFKFRKQYNIQYHICRLSQQQSTENIHLNMKLDFMPYALYML